MSSWVGADCLHSRGGPSAVPYRTVYSALADCLKKPHEPPVAHHKTQTICHLPADHPLHMDRPYSTHGSSAKPRAPKSTDKMDRTKDTKELATNTNNNWLDASSRTVCMGLADRLSGPHTAARARPFEGQPFLPFT
jgi:hypothetical protein